MSELESSVELTTTDVTPESSPVEAVEPQVVETEEFDTDEAEITEQPGAESGATRRIKQLAAQRRAEQEARIKAEKELEYYRGMQASREPVQKPVQKTPAWHEAVPTAPSLDTFESFEEYERAKDEYLVQLTTYRIAQQVKQQHKDDEEASIQKKFDAKVMEASSMDPAIRNIISDVGMKISPEMGTVIKQSDTPVELVRWLHKNPAEMQRIAQLSPFLAAKELGYVEATLRNAPKPAPPKRVSAAPEPIQVLTPTSPSSVEDEDLPMDEYYRRRTKQMYGR